MGTGEPWGCGDLEGGGEDSELPQDRGWKGPSLALDWLGAESGGSPAGEALGEGARSAAGAGRGGGSAGARGRRPRTGPGVAGARSSAGVAAAMRRPPAVRRNAARGSRNREGEPGARTCAAGAGKRAESRAARGGARRGPSSRRGRPEGAGARRGRPGSGLAARGVSPLGAFGREARVGKRVPEDQPSPRGASRGAVRSPRVEGGPRQHPEAATGFQVRVRGGPRRSEIWQGGGRTLWARGCDSPSWPRAAEGKLSAAPYRPGRGAAPCGAAAFRKGVGSASSVGPRSFQIRGSARPVFVTLGRSLHSSNISLYVCQMEGMLLSPCGIHGNKRDAEWMPF